MSNVIPIAPQAFTTAQSPFLRLPKELRLDIYHLSLPSRGQMIKFKPTYRWDKEKEEKILVKAVTAAYWMNPWLSVSPESRTEMKRFYDRCFDSQLDGAGVWMSNQDIPLFKSPRTCIEWFGNTFEQYNQRYDRGRMIYTPNKAMEITQTIAFTSFPKMYFPDIRTLSMMGAPINIYMVHRVNAHSSKVNNNIDFKQDVLDSWVNNAEEAEEELYEEPPNVHLLNSRQMMNVLRDAGPVTLLRGPKGITNKFSSEKMDEFKKSCLERDAVIASPFMSTLQPIVDNAAGKAVEALGVEIVTKFAKKGVVISTSDAQQWGASILAVGTSSVIGATDALYQPFSLASYLPDIDATPQHQDEEEEDISTAEEATTVAVELNMEDGTEEEMESDVDVVIEVSGPKRKRFSEESIDDLPPAKKTKNFSEEDR